MLQSPEILVSSSGWSYGRERRDDQPARPQAICAADFNADVRLDLLLGDHYFVSRSPTEEQRSQIAEAAAKEDSIRSDYRKLIGERPTNETRQERIERFRKALRKCQEFGALPWVRGGLGSGPENQRHGHVWFYERIAAKNRES